MAATDGMSSCNLEAEYSINFSAWTDFGDFAGVITPSPQTRAMGEFYAFKRDVPIVTPGALSSVQIDVTMLFTDAATDPFTIARAQHKTACGAPFYLRWSNNGGAAGDLQFTTTENESWISSFPDPGGDKSSPDPTTIQFQVYTSDVDAALVV